MPISGGVFMHAMIRVGNPEKSIAFYSLLGLKVLRTKDFPEDKFSLVFLGYESERNATALELTYNYGVEAYAQPENPAFGHLCFGVDDVVSAVSTFRDLGYTINYLSDDGYMAFILDPDKYEIELLEKKRMFAEAEKDYVDQKTISAAPPADAAE
jgi:lactoylglutathione lyase